MNAIPGIRPPILGILLLITLCGSAGWFATLPAQASPTRQATLDPELVVTWQGADERGYQLYKPNGIFSSILPASLVWWDTAAFASSCPPNVEVSDDGATIYVRGWWSAAQSSQIEDQNCNALAGSGHTNVLRHGQLLYYFVDGRLSRKAINNGPEIAAIPTTMAPISLI